MLYLYICQAAVISWLWRGCASVVNTAKVNQLPAIYISLQKLIGH